MRRQINQIGSTLITVTLTVGCSGETPSNSDSEKSSEILAESAAVQSEPLVDKSSTTNLPIATEDQTNEVAVKATPINELSVSQLLEQSIAAMQSGDEATAYALSRSALKRQPNDPQTRFTYGLVLGSRKRFPEAIRILDDVATVMPAAKLPALGQTAEWMVKFGMYEKAEQRFREVLQLAPGAAMAHSRLAELLIRQGRRLEAAPHLETLCQSGEIDEFLLRSMLSFRAPLSGDAENRLVDPIRSVGKARRQIALGDWQQAIKTLQGSSAIDSSKRNDALLGRCFAEQADWDQLNAWNDRHPNDPGQHSDGWFARGTWLEHLKKYELAIDSFLKCVSIDPTDAQAYRRLAECLRREGQAETAQSAQTRAELIFKTQTLGNALASSAVRGGAQLTEMVNALAALRRFDEALAWRQLQVGYAQEFGMLYPQQASQIRNELDAERKRLLAEGQFERDESFITCGLRPTAQK